MIVPSLLYYKKVLKTLKSTVFQINPYDPCVAYRMVNDKKKTVCFHAENCKLSHQDRKVNNQFINKLRDEYDSVFEDGRSYATS